MWKPDPLSQAAMPSNEIGSTGFFMLFPQLHDSKSLEQCPERKITYDDPCNSSLDITTVAPRRMRMSIQQATLTWRRSVLENLKGETHLLVQKQNFKISGLEVVEK